MKRRTSPIRLGMVLTALAAAGMALAQTEPVVAPPQEKQVLKVGDKAPNIYVAKWLKGDATTTFKPGQVYVVEFWATWCGPCKQSIPHLTELAKKYAGKVSFNGISVWEEKDPIDEKYIEKVDTFVKEWGDKMAYNVAVDGKEGTMSKTWMEAAKQGGIPSAFVVNQEGVIAWIGHPMADDFEGVLGKVIDGKFDIAAARAKAEQEAKDESEMQELVKPLESALATGDPNIILTEADKLIAKKPSMEPMVGPLKFQMLFDSQKEAELYAYMEKSFKGFAKDNAQFLNEMAWTVVENKEKKLAKPNYALSIKVAERAVELEPEDAAIMDTLAFAHFKKGNVKKAIELQTKAVALLDKSNYPDEMKAEIKARLEEFKKKG